MFGWGRKKPTAQPPLTAEMQKALDMGKRLGDDMNSDLDRLMTLRFEPVFERCIGILRGSIQAGFDNRETPPIWTARAQFDVFTENVGDLRSKMTVEINGHMHDWSKVADEVGVRELFDQLIAKQVDDFASRLTLTGAKLLVDYGPALIDADTAWRKANPEQAQHFPLPPPPTHPVVEQTLSIIQERLNRFVREDYNSLTDRCFRNYAVALQAIDDRDPEAANFVDQHTDAFRAEANRLNEWAWDTARSLIDGDISQLDAHLSSIKDQEFGSLEDQKFGQRCADIVERTIERQTKELIADVGRCRKARLDVIAGTPPIQS